MGGKCDSSFLDTVEKSVEDCAKNEAFKAKSDFDKNSDMSQMLQLCTKVPDAIKKCGVNYSTCYPDYVIR